MAHKRKTILSFYCDDTGPYRVGAKPFQTFLDYCAEQKIAGESSAILGGSGHSMTRDPSAEEKAFLKQVARAWDCGIGTHMEVMTHGALFDFKANRPREGAVHEGLWLHEPAVTQAEYERYFRSIIAEGERAGIRFTGFTWPGCGCDPCTRRYRRTAAPRASPRPTPLSGKRCSRWLNKENSAGRRFRASSAPTRRRAPSTGRRPAAAAASTTSCPTRGTSSASGKTIPRA